jgi:hypothetical protein
MAVALGLPNILTVGTPVNWQAPLNRGLVGWWKVLRERMGGVRWLDLAGTNHGDLPTVMLPRSAVSGFNATTRSGGLGEMRFDGTDDTMQAGTGTPTLDLDVFTLSFWVWGTTQVNAYGGIMWRMLFGTAGWAVQIDNVGPNLYMRVDTSGGISQGLFFTGAFSLLDAQWHNATFTINNGSVAAYKDGVFVASATYVVGTGLRASTSLNFGLGAPKIALDDIRITARILEDSEVMALYRASLTGYRQELNWHDAVALMGASPPGVVSTKAPPPRRSPLRFFRRAA